MKQSVCEGRGEQDAAGPQCPHSAGGGHGQDGVLPAVGDGAGEVAVGVHIDGNDLTGLRGGGGGHGSDVIPVRCGPAGPGGVLAAGGADRVLGGVGSSTGHGTRFMTW